MIELASDNYGATVHDRGLTDAKLRAMSEQQLHAIRFDHSGMYDQGDKIRATWEFERRRAESGEGYFLEMPLTSEDAARSLPELFAEWREHVRNLFGRG